MKPDESTINRDSYILSHLFVIIRAHKNWFMFLNIKGWNVERGFFFS